MTEKVSIPKYWDGIARKTKEHYRSKFIVDCYRYENTILLNEWCGLIEDKKVLVTDLFNEAFDREELPQNFYSPNKNIIGMDISECVAKRAQIRYPSNIHIACDINHLSFKDNCFDIVISPSTLDHNSKNNLSRPIEEIRRVLKNNGVFIIALHNKQNMFFYFYLLKLQQLLKTKNALPFHLELYSKNQIIQLLEKNKFYIEKSTAIRHILFPKRLLNYFKKKEFLKKKIYNFNILLSRLDTKYFTGRFIAVKAKKV